MLIQMQRVPNVANFKELYEHTLEMLKQIPEEKTMVLGPVTDPDAEAMEENLFILFYYAKQLSEKGLVVLDLHSFQPAVEQIIQRQKLQGYPYGILTDFTLPLIRSGHFRPLYFRERFRDSLGATLEHDVALGRGIQVTYLP